MPLRSWIKICWSACIVVGLLIPLSFFSLFFSAGKADGDEYGFELPGQTGDQPKPVVGFDDYGFIWKAKINVERKKNDIPLLPKQSKPKLANDLKRYVVIKNIFSSQVGLISIGGRDKKIAAAPKPIRVQKPNEEWKWELRLPNGRAVTVKKLVPQEGVRFQSGAEEAFLKFKYKGKKKVGKAKSKEKTKTRSQTHRVEVGKNHWQISSQEGEELLNDYDKYVTDLAPVPCSNPPGLLIRRVDSASKIYDYGLRAEDVITDINGVPIRSQEQIGELIKGPEQKKVVIKLLRKTDSGRREKIEFIFEAH